MCFNNIYLGKFVAIGGLFLFLYELPQNILGYIRSLHCTRVHKFGGIVVCLTDKYDGSMCLGRYIFVSYEPDGILFRHEYGHRLQSMFLGWLYIPMIFVPSYIRCRYLFDKNGTLDEYYDFYTESCANMLSRKKAK